MNEEGERVGSSFASALSAAELGARVEDKEKEKQHQK